MLFEQLRDKYARSGHPSSDLLLRAVCEHLEGIGLQLSAMGGRVEAVAESLEEHRGPGHAEPDLLERIQRLERSRDALRAAVDSVGKCVRTIEDKQQANVSQFVTGLRTLNSRVTDLEVTNAERADRVNTLSDRLRRVEADHQANEQARRAGEDLLLSLRMTVLGGLALLDAGHPREPIAKRWLQEHDAAVGIRLPDSEQTKLHRLLRAMYSFVALGASMDRMADLRRAARDA
jgi:hypothetical protein